MNPARSAAHALFEELRSDGEAALTRWVGDRREEGVHLECKRSAPTDKPGMARADIEQMAKTAAAFANSEGGVLIFGVDARNEGGLDCIQQLVPIEGLAAFARSADRVKSDLLAPAHPGVEVLAIPSARRADSGYLAVRIDQSERRPHRSLKDQIYYRRSHDRTFPMEHSDLKDAMSRTAGAALEIAIDIADVIFADGVTAEASNSFNILVAISLENTGAAMARFPFLHLETSPGGVLYNPVMDRPKAPVWPRLTTDTSEQRLQGGTDDVIPVSTKVRVAFALWTYKRDTNTIGGQPLGRAVIGLGGRFGCDGMRTTGFELIFQPAELIAELNRRGIPLKPMEVWPPVSKS